jgi:halocyanin-like protein
MTQKSESAATSRTDRSGFDRRTVLKTGASAAAMATLGAGTAAATGPSANSRSQAGVDLTDWLSNVGNFDGIADERGSDEVSVSVGAQGNGGAFGFGPAVVRVDPGTTVVWEWTGKGGSHNVAADAGGFESPMQGNEGDTFEHTFDSAGVRRYVCVPHESMGMKAAVVVGDLDVATPDPAASGESGGSDSGGDGAESGSESGDGDGDVDYGGWFENVSNFEGTVDRTGEDEIVVEVGVEGNGAAYAYGPPAVRVDPGTTVVWEWTGKGGSHNVVADDDSYESELLGDAGDTFEHTFESEGISKYYCTPHEGLGMKGAVVVGGSGGIDPAEAGGDGDGSGEADGVGNDLWLYGLAGAFASALFAPLAFASRNDDSGNQGDRARGRRAEYRPKH